ncbi:MAG: Mannose-6-phosphate isomerase, partial [Myxococcaceae bacterium]|nr:Mannose-6-phosphate isomerase [Myxococcaceae bacterium]
RGDALLARCRLRAGAPDLAGAATWVELCGRDAGLRSEHLHVARAHGTGELELPDWDSLRALTVVDGEVTLDGLTVRRGQTAALPARPAVRRASLSGAHAIVSAVY